MTSAITALLLTGPTHLCTSPKDNYLATIHFITYSSRKLVKVFLLPVISRGTSCTWHNPFSWTILRQNHSKRERMMFGTFSDTTVLSLAANKQSLVVLVGAMVMIVPN
ncbi:hypothetical protein K503DRAFT_357231 [Rhizopogon vinicolor AM-OR11-026]|uniref:Uncharacterized protein n=1 Tax=Rhizopogon vinicolor AM-OR11-026 TaxID=1314800 RepID=A0A1B7MSM9_9AGAM|nr:hypothetical protein K503DRAFT_357231 [Rhizopogon vinicolor AM-OR11-026]